jgi:hypothetical protein
VIGRPVLGAAELVLGAGESLGGSLAGSGLGRFGPFVLAAAFPALFSSTSPSSTSEGCGGRAPVDLNVAAEPRREELAGAADPLSSLPSLFCGQLASAAPGV